MLNIYRRIALVLISVFTVLSSSPSLRAQQDEKKDKSFNDLQFRSIGPAFMAGRIADIAINPNDESEWYVAVGSGGVWKTHNNGVTWKPIFDDQSSYSTGCVTIDPNNPNVVWVGTGENVGGRHVGYGDGIYRSGDGGKTWQNLGLRESEHVSKIIVHPENPDKVYVAAQGPLWDKGGQRGFYKTEDGGETWTQTLGDKEWIGVTDILMDPRNPDRMYAATWQRHRTIAAYLGGGPKTALYRSEDGGTTWKKLKNGLPKSNMGKIGLAMSPQNPDVIYAAIELDHREGGIYKSTDRGNNWEKESDVVSGATGPHYYQELYASPHKEGRLYLMDVRCQISEDGGKTFRTMEEEFKHSDNHAMAFKMSDPEYLLFGTDGGLYESFDLGSHWRFVDNMPITQFYKLAVDDAEPFYNIYGGTQDNSTQGGPSRTANVHGIQNYDWRVVLNWDGHEPAVEPGNPNIVYGQRQEGTLSRIDMATGEVTDIQPQPGEGAEYERFNWDAPILVSPHKPSRIYFASQRLWKSEDRGDSWEAISGDLTKDQERITQDIMGRQQSWDNAWDFYAMSNFNTITSIAVSPVQEGLIMVGTDDGLLQKTDNSGSSWQQIALSELPGAPANAYVNNIMADLYDAQTFYVALDNHKNGDFSPYLYKTNDGGESWSNIGQDLPERHVVWRLVQDHKQKDLLFIGTEFGVFYTLDGGANWRKLKGGMPNIPVRDLTIQRREDDLVVSTFGRSFYIFDDIELFRHMDEDKRQGEAKLVPTRDAWWYVPRSHLSFGDKKGSQGASHYVADNPPFGAMLTYYLAEGYPGLEKQRQKEEKPLRKSDQDIPFPGWESLADEMQQREPQIRIHIYNGEDELVRKVAAPTDSGFHRVAWDLKYPPMRAIGLDKEKIEGSGMLAPPGRYYAQVFHVDSGKTRALTEKTGFSVKPLYEGTLENPRRDLRDEYWRAYEDLVRQYSAFAKKMNRTVKKADALELAYRATPIEDSSVTSRVFALKADLDEMQKTVMGNPAKRKIGEKTKPTVGQRIFTLARILSHSTYGPTTTAIETRQIVEDQLEQFSQELGELESEADTLSERIQRLGGPAVVD